MINYIHEVWWNIIILSTLVEQKANLPACCCILFYGTTMIWYYLFMCIVLKNVFYPQNQMPGWMELKLGRRLRFRFIMID